MYLKSAESYITNISSLFQKSVGIYFAEQNIDVVEVKKYFKKYKITISHTYTFQDPFPDCIDKDFGLKDKLVSMNFNPKVASYKLINIPDMDESEIDGWIDENKQNFLPTGVSHLDIFINYIIVKHNGSMLILLSICDKGEIEKINAIWNQTDFNIAIISPGLLGCVDFHSAFNDKIYCILIKGKEISQVMIIKSDDLIYYNQIPVVFQKDKKQPLYETAYQLFEDDFRLLGFIPTEKNCRIIDEDSFDSPGKSKETSPAYSLAIAPFIQGKKTLNYISRELKTRLETFQWKRVLINTILGLGSISLTLYLIIYLLSVGLSQMTAKIENERAMLIPHLNQIGKLEKERTVTLKDLTDSKSILKYRSSKQLILTIISYHIPEGCWLYKVSTDENEESPYNTILTGISKNRATVHEFFGNLEGDNNIKKIKLDHINAIDSDKMYRNWKIRNRNLIDFQIELTF